MGFKNDYIQNWSRNPGFTQANYNENEEKSADSACVRRKFSVYGLKSLDRFKLFIPCSCSCIIILDAMATDVMFPRLL